MPRCRRVPAICVRGLLSLTPRCAGGAACALFDDAVGWMGFCHTGNVAPWSGFTAQVSASLKRPIRAGSVLMLRASVDRLEGRKVGSAFLR